MLTRVFNDMDVTKELIKKKETRLGDFATMLFLHKGTVVARLVCDFVSPVFVEPMSGSGSSLNSGRIVEVLSRSADPARYSSRSGALRVIGDAVLTSDAGPWIS